MNFILYSPYNYGNDFLLEINQSLARSEHLILPTPHKGVYTYRFSMEETSLPELPARIKIKSDEYIKYLDKFYISSQYEGTIYFSSIFDHIADNYNLIVNKYLNIRVYEELFSTLNTFNIPVRVLDFGCGAGLGAEAIQNLKIKSDQIQVHGCDISKNMLSQMSLANFERYESIHLLHDRMDIFQQEYFDIIALVFVAHMLNATWITELFSLLIPSGILIFNEYKPQTYHDRYSQLTHHASAASTSYRVVPVTFNGQCRSIRLVYVSKQ